MTTLVSFTWVPLYEEIAGKLVEFRHRQPELLAFLEGLRAKGLTITPFNDRDAQGRQIPLGELDPFTFLGTFNRGLRHPTRLAILKEVATFLGCTSPLPTDFDGIPTVNNQNSWFVGYKVDRKPNDVAKLWNVFAAALVEDPLNDPAFQAAFDSALAVRGVNFNLTMGLFWIRPDVFFNLDGKNRERFNVDIPRGGLEFKFYRETLESIRRSHDKSFVQLSHEAFVGAERTSPDTSSRSSPRASDTEYWMVGAFWPQAEPPDQTDRMLKGRTWENGYEDRFLEEVRSMKPGDRIAIKAATTQRDQLPFNADGRTVSRMVIKATGTIVANPGTGRSVDVEWDPSREPRDWYFYTGRPTVWRLRKDEEFAQRLIQFAFHDQPQDYQFFLENGYGDASDDDTDRRKVEGLPSSRPFGVKDALDKGLFVPNEEIQSALRRLRSKLNLVLQGAPGVGKTYFARLLAYLLLESEDDSRITYLQFHPSYSYEDFVRGYRPGKEPSQFVLEDGPLHHACEKAKTDPDRPYVLIIDELNRGNLAQVFGELFLLLERDKRGSKCAVTPLYRRQPGERFWVPPNLHIVGTMNIADRSLALVDFALRRRFSFMTLSPRFGDPQFRRWLTDKGVESRVTDRVITRMQELNRAISEDTRLGPAFQVGHSFFCPHGTDLEAKADTWYEDVVRTEILPLLSEYWYDDPSRVSEAETQLLG